MARFLSNFSVIFSVLFLLSPNLLHAAWGLNMTQGVTPISQDVYNMHMTSLYVVTIIGILVFSVMFWSIFHHRKSKGVKPAKFSHSTTVEIIWTLIPFAIIVALAIPATKLLARMDDTSKSEITVKATGYQWKWKYDYIDEDITIYSNLASDSVDASQRNSGIDPKTADNYLRNTDTALVLPVGKKIRIMTTASDVIHAWWVPDLGWKRDAIPGFINDNWTVINKEGIYRGQCAEICGKGHGYMPIVVKAVPEKEYLAWVQETKLALKSKKDSGDKELSMDELKSKGEAVYKANCLACHQANGQGIKGVFPALDGSPIATVKTRITEHIRQVIYGKNNMPAFGEQLSDTDIAAVVTYERNVWGNKTGDIIQPKDVAASRKK
ncbi:cytochrome c oxidase subunit II [Candidatus Methylopumilus rimovensis]|uniref:Cytochrome c oxidase subunit 2 n=2 Tax=Candidatus Methylopumilus rimovensis TaxID=2588535 RepID=A0AAE6FTS7_9PROT|nr:cytochrome c oxidase subunit II [Candidatus Methylopumilus rimovensis]QDD12875.1 cytochrome c oxidase subunit II [Candidatus Methylopumilus rimovensis]QDD13869.1 cytochrome c oxidase subunit II [Candidatus Methylopumilus rimovensis]